MGVFALRLPFHPNFTPPKPSSALRLPDRGTLACIPYPQPILYLPRPPKLATAIDRSTTERDPSGVFNRGSFTSAREGE